MWIQKATYACTLSLVWLVLLLVLCLASLSELAASTPDQLLPQVTNSSLINPEMRQSAMLKIVSQLEATLQEAVTELANSKAERQKVDAALTKSQSELIESETERNALKARSIQLSNQINDLQTQVTELQQQLSVAYSSWQNSEKSRKDRDQAESLLEARIIEDQQALQAADRQKVIVGIGAATGGAIIGVIIYEVVKMLIRLFSGVL